MAGGLVASIITFAVGAVLDFAVTVGPDQHGFNIHNVGCHPDDCRRCGSCAFVDRVLRLEWASTAPDDH